ncbi:MAG: NAD-dependent epimerase/dehydratase family protein [Pseudomonadota bacterium]
MHGNALILGANGRFGRNAAEAFWNAGWRVTLFDRATDDLTTAAHGQDVIVNGWNPAYTDWAADVPALTQQVIDAARTNRCTVVIPGNVYVYGPDAPPVLTPATPHAATNPLGRIRIEMEAAYRASGVQTILLRAGDFIDTEASGNWFDKVITPQICKGKISYPGPLDAAHAWAYLPDLARAAAALAAKRDALGVFTDVSFPGYTLTGAELAQSIDFTLGRTVTPHQMSWLPLQLARPVWKMASALLEMRYLWHMPHRLDGAAFHTLLPNFVETPVEVALGRALQDQIRPDQAMTRTVISVAA